MVARWSRTLMLVALVQAVLGTAVAVADGLPVLGVEGSSHGVRSLDGKVSYGTRAAGRDTRVLRLSPGGRAIAAVRLRGRLVVPVVAYDGSSAGLSADGRTLVLIRPRVRFPQETTSLVILATRRLTLRSRMRLRGDYSFDAISPNGHWIYLIQYISAADPTRYRVRALNLQTGRLLGRDIVDPHNRREAMHGAPVTRVSSPDGRWAYTLYDGNGHPFVHALDTAARTARCLDVPGLQDASSARLRLDPDAGQLLVRARDRTAAIISTRTLAVSRPVAPVRQRPRLRHTERGGVGGLPLTPAGIALLAGSIVVICRHRRKSPRPAEAR